MAGRDHNDGGGGRGRGGGNDSQRQKANSKGKRVKGNGNRSSKNTTPNNNRSVDVRPKWVCKTDELKNDTFIWGDGMNDKYSSSRQHFLQFAGKSFTGNEKKSIENGFHTLIGVEVPPTVNNEQDFNNLSWNMQQRYDTVEKEHTKAKQKLINNLSTLYHHLIEACEPTLLGKIKRHPDFTFDKADGIPCAMALMIIIQDLCSSTVGINYLPEIAMTKSDNVISNPDCDTEFDENEGNDYNNHEENVSNNIINEENDYNNNNDDGSNKYGHSTKHNSDNSSEFARTTNRYGVLWTKNDDNNSVISDSDTEYDNKYFDDIHSRKDNESDEKSETLQE